MRTLKMSARRGKENEGKPHKKRKQTARNRLMWLSEPYIG